MENILFVLKIPPPVHGSTLMNQKVLESKLLRQSFNCNFLAQSISTEVSDIGKFSVRKIINIFGAYSSLFNNLRMHKPKLVYFALSPYGAAFIKDYISYCIIRLFSATVVFHLHGKGIREQGKKSILFNALYKSLFKKNYAICLAPELTSDIDTYIKNPPYIVPNGIEDFNFKELRNGYKKDNRRFKIIFLSNFIKSKGILDIVEASQILKGKQHLFSLSFIGIEGDISNEQLEAILNSSDLNRTVNHLGPLYEEDKYKELANCDLLVFPTSYKNECLPLVLIEAMQCGLPVISTYEGGIPSVVDNNVNGFLIEKSDINALVSKMEYLIQHPEKVKEMGMAARKKYESHFTLEKFEHNLVRVLNAVLSETSKVK